VNRAIWNCELDKINCSRFSWRVKRIKRYSWGQSTFYDWRSKINLFTLTLKGNKLIFCIKALTYYNLLLRSLWGRGKRRSKFLQVDLLHETKILI
jgi:hypothetical protein